MTDNVQPRWIGKALEMYRSGVSHAFILHFNVGDYAGPDNAISIVDYLTRMYAKREVVAIYSRDRGITFGTEGQKKRALEILNISQQAGQVDPALAALQSLGAAPAADSDELPTDPTQALPLLDQLLRSSSEVAVIIDGADLVVPPTDLATMQPADRVALGTIRRWGRDAEIINSGNVVYLLAASVGNIHPELRTASNRFEAIEVSLPDTGERCRFVKGWLAKSDKKIDLALPVEAVANASAGLSLLHIEDILLRAERAGSLTPDLIWERKRDIIRSEFGDVLEVIEPKLSFKNVGGLGHIKKFFVHNVIRPILEGRKSRVPMGVLFTGPAGTGKTIMAEAVATEAKVNAVMLRMGKIADKYQGEGERKLDRALLAIASLAPCIVFMDEIDQQVQRGGDASGGGQQNQRIFQRLLEFMSDTTHRGEVIFLAATNRPDLMDPALKRPGRFDISLLFPPPDDQERKEIIEVVSLEMLGAEMVATDEMSRASDGWTGAELQGAGRKANALIEDYGLTPQEAMLKAIKTLKPVTKDIEFMTMLGLQEVSDPDLLPPRYRQVDRAEVEAKIEAAQDKVERAERRRGQRDI